MSTKDAKREQGEQHILKEGKTRWESVAMAWIISDKAYDIVLPTWTIVYLKYTKQLTKA